MQNAIKGKDTELKVDSGSVYESGDMFICPYCDATRKRKHPKQKYCDSEHKRLYHKMLHDRGAAVINIDGAKVNKMQKLFKYLLTGKKTSLEIGTHINTWCVSTRVSHLRQKGCDIRGRYLGRSKSGSQIWEYTLLSFPKHLFSNYSR